MTLFKYNKNTKVYGLTGGIASGKSFVADVFSKLGVPVLDADQVSKQLTQPGGLAYDQVTELFGTADRKKIRQRILEEPAAKKALEDLLHPLIVRESAIWFEACRRAGESFVVYEAALLVETERYKNLDGLIVVVAPLQKRIEWLMTRDQVDQKSAQKMIDSQLSDKHKVKFASIVFENNGSLDDLKRQVLGWYQGFE